VKDVVALAELAALFEDLTAQHLARGQVGTVVDRLNSKKVFVEFSDDQGRPYAIAPAGPSSLLFIFERSEMRRLRAAG
jgi:Domain of unknown function (DUF4926)